MTEFHSVPKILSANPYTWETQDYRVVPGASQDLYPGKLVYLLQNKVTGVVEAEGFQLAFVIAGCLTLQQALDDVRSGALVRLPRQGDLFGDPSFPDAAGKPN